MDRHNRRDPVAPRVFGLSVVLMSFTVAVGALLFLRGEGKPDWPGWVLIMLMAGAALSTAVYAVVYPIYRGIRRLTTRGASKPHPVAYTLWYLTLGALLFMFIAIPMYGAPSGRPRVAKAQADTRAIASAISIYFHHCSGLPPADSSRTDCPVAAETGGPHPVPKSLLVQQTNARGEVVGPFLNAMPTLPAGWTGAGNTYAYYGLSGGKFLICAVGDSTGADSDGGAPTECGNREWAEGTLRP